MMSCFKNFIVFVPLFLSLIASVMPRPYYALERYSEFSEYQPLDSGYNLSVEDEKQSQKIKPKISRDKHLFGDITCIKTFTDPSTQINYDLNQIYLCQQLATAENNDNSILKKDNVQPNWYLTQKKHQNDLKLMPYKFAFNYNNAYKQKFNGEISSVKRDNDYIQFGRSDPTLKDLPQATANNNGVLYLQQKKQDNTKQTGNTYDYVRFGKRSSPNLLK